MTDNNKPTMRWNKLKSSNSRYKISQNTFSKKLLIGTTLELWRTYLSSDTERKGLTDWEERSPDQLLFLFYQYSYVINQQGLWATLYYDCIPTAKYSIISVYYICPQLKIEKRLRSKNFLQTFLDFNFCFQIFT